MPNSIAVVKDFLLNIMDKIYMTESLTAGMDINNSMVRAINPDRGEYYIPKIAFDKGLGDYNKATGFPSGSVTLDWIMYKLTKDRARSFVVDAVDNMESAGEVMANLASEFMRTEVVPEIDAYRFSTYASKAGVLGTTGAISESTIIKDLTDALALMSNKHVPKPGRKIYMSTSALAVLNEAMGGKLNTYSNESFNSIVGSFNKVPIVEVPDDRFYDKVTISSTDGFSVPTGAVTMDFMIVHPSAIFQLAKRATTRLFTPEGMDGETYQVADAFCWQYRLYHDAFVLGNKTAGIYVHKPTASEGA